MVSVRGGNERTLIQSQTTFYSSENWSLETVTVKCSVIFVILYRDWMVYIIFLLMVIMKFGVLMVCPLSVLFVQRCCSRTDQTYAGPRVRKPPVPPAAPTAGEQQTCTFELTCIRCILYCIHTPTEYILYEQTLSHKWAYRFISQLRCTETHCFSTLSHVHTFTHTHKLS